MQTNFIPTHEYYRRILSAPDAQLRQQMYLDLLVQPWKPMMDLFSAGNDDPLSGARAWAWLLPEQVEQMTAILEKLEAVNAWETGDAALKRTAACFAPYAERIPFDTIDGWLVLADPDRSNPLERGYSGATDWMQPRFIGQFWDPNEENLRRLPGLVAHEMHHLIRNRVFPFGPQTSVADYIVTEGTAESFATSLFGEENIGLFISEFDPADLDTARRLIAPALSATGFDVIRGYIFGDKLAERGGFRPVGGMPTFGGYAVGYYVVQSYLKNSGRSIEEATFIPAEEIVRESGFLD